MRALRVERAGEQLLELVDDQDHAIELRTKQRYQPVCRGGPRGEYGRFVVADQRSNACHRGPEWAIARSHRDHRPSLAARENAAPQGRHNPSEDDARLTDAGRADKGAGAVHPELVEQALRLGLPTQVDVLVFLRVGASPGYGFRSSPPPERALAPVLGLAARTRVNSSAEPASDPVKLTASTPRRAGGICSAVAPGRRTGITGRCPGDARSWSISCCRHGERSPSGPTRTSAVRADWIRSKDARVGAASTVRGSGELDTSYPPAAEAHGWLWRSVPSHGRTR